MSKVKCKQCKKKVQVVYKPIEKVSKDGMKILFPYCTECNMLIPHTKGKKK